MHPFDEGILLYDENISNRLRSSGESAVVIKTQVNVLHVIIHEPRAEF